MKRYFPYLFALIALLPVIWLRDLTPGNELRYLAIADEALRRGTWFTFTLDGAPYADKPPLYFWLLMVVRWLTGSFPLHLFPLVSLAASFAVIGTLSRWSADEGMAPHLRRTSVWMMLICGLFTGAAIFVRMDMLMCLFITLALRSFWLIRRGGRRQTLHRWLFPVFVFLALFTKGPVGVLVPLLSTAVFLLFTDGLRTFPRYWGWRTWLVLLSACALWFSAVWAEGGRAYLDNLLFHQTVDRAVRSFHHQEPFYYYFQTIWYILAPWSLLVVGLTVSGVRRWRVLADWQQFFLIIGLTTFAMLSFISSKIEIYLLPAVPFLVFGSVSVYPRTKGMWWQSVSVGIPALACACTLPVVVALLCLGTLRVDGLETFLPAATVLSASGVTALFCLLRHRGVLHVARILAMGLLLTLCTGGWAVQRVLNPRLSYGTVCRHARILAEEYGADRFCTWNIPRTAGIDFYLHHPVENRSPEEIVSGQMHRIVLLLPASDVDSLPQELKGAPMYLRGKYAAIVIK